jgi:predicted phage baseplate assembly protein
MNPAGSCCGCDGGAPLTPVPVANRPGLDALAYRAGTYPTFFAAMRARLSAGDYPALAGLTTHDVSDPAVALLDAWAVAGDVLTFYQERIANEGYLRTATERRSVLEQARLIGYRPRPGVASSVYLAYTIDPNAGPVEIPAGALVNSVPGPGEQMQAFETSDALEARPEWNELRVRMSQPQTPRSILDQGLFLNGTAAGLNVGDALLVDFGVGRGLEPFRVYGITPDAGADRTQVQLVTWDGQPPAAALVEATVRPLTSTDRFGVDPGTATAARVLEMLDEVGARGASDDREGLAAYLGDALPALAGVLDTAETSGWTRLLPWLREVVTGLSGLHRLVADGPPGSGIRPEAMIRGAPAFGDVLDRLEAPPSLPPRSSRQLSRSVATALAPHADIYPALLAAFKPQLKPVLYTALGHSPAAPESQVHVLALRHAAPLFGASAPRQAILLRGTMQRPEWDLETDEKGNVAHLDRVYPGVSATSVVLIVRPESAKFPRTLLTTATAAAEVSRSAYGLSGRITRLEVAKDWWNPATDGQQGEDFDQTAVLRATTVFCQAEELHLADAPIGDDVCAGELELDRLYDGLGSGRWMILSGERADIPGTTGVPASELVMLAEVAQRVKLTAAIGKKSLFDQPLPGDSLHTFVTFASPLAYCYRRGSVVLNGNVVHATHGETRAEVLGAGDASQALQTFTLKQPPLTFTSAPSVTGTVSTLAVRVGGVSWPEAGSLAGLGPASRGFLTRQDDEGRTSVVFGDGDHGARLPTGQDNVQATYRSGIGAPGNVQPGQISLLATKPLGVKAVTNPLRASGGADRDGRDDIRRNAPLAVLALDRLVSVQDYADFARTFAGIGKASAARLSDGTRTQVHVTIAGAADIPIDVTSDLYRNLNVALHQFGDPFLPVAVGVRELLALVVSAQVKVLPGYDWELVEPAIRTRLLDAFGFGWRELGQDVLPSEVITAIQGVAGVDYVDLDALRSIDEATAVSALSPQPPGQRPLGQPPPPSAGPVEVSPARVVAGAVRPAQLAYLQPLIQDSLILNEVPA